ncbi:MULTISPECIES: DUF4232 domain-containing protein [Streptomyces]|uniref:DUF4232 domain-containing protein n=1 Tax=Streptomyces TaxID=1883 RepID=UPI00292CFE2E|nr:DUF4232 domain-containing protein [Streptomyces sp. NEAU-HV9]
MRLCTTVAAPAVSATAAALLFAAPQAGAVPQAKAGTCPEKYLSVRARASAADPAVVRISVTNRGGRTCTVDPVPTVTFGDLDGGALPVPARGAGTYRLGAGGTAYAAVRTIADPADPEARRVGTLTVAGDPSHWGRSFTAAELGAGDAIRVWEPVTTWWRPSAADADRALEPGRGESPWSGGQPKDSSGL